MKHKEITEKVAAYIMSRNLNQLSQLTCYKIAELFDINLSYLSSRFKKDTKVSLFDFIESEKMLQVRVLLKTRTDLTIEDISRQFGLEKIEQFRSRFKKYFFITPGKYKHILKNQKIGVFS